PGRLSQLKLASASFSDGQQRRIQLSATATTAGRASAQSDLVPSFIQHCKRQPQPGVGGRLQRMRRSPDRHHQQQLFCSRRKTVRSLTKRTAGRAMQSPPSAAAQQLLSETIDHGEIISLSQHLFRNRHNWNHCNNNTNRGHSSMAAIRLTDDDLLEAAYELHLSEKSARGPYSRVFDGQAEEICLRDLQPGQRPRPPKRLRLRNSAGAGRYVLVWSAPEDDGGCPIEEYLPWSRSTSAGSGPTLSYSVPAEQREFDAANWLPAGGRTLGQCPSQFQCRTVRAERVAQCHHTGASRTAGTARLRGRQDNGEMRLAWSTRLTMGRRPDDGVSKQPCQAPKQLLYYTVSSVQLCTACSIIAAQSSLSPCECQLYAPLACEPAMPSASAPVQPLASAAAARCLRLHRREAVGQSRLVHRDPMSRFGDAQVNDDAAEPHDAGWELVDADLLECPLCDGRSSSTACSSSACGGYYRLECRVETGDGGRKSRKFRAVSSGEDRDFVHYKQL
uniref:Fibronectin type-III domain-containing protein n=1 Tax=Macrostomum lignano TaxID=282301 RepID=A0A1I8FMX5_9PLAT